MASSTWTSGWDGLIPRPYRYLELDSYGNTFRSTVSFAGLIGDLLLLIALVAFSAVPSALCMVLENHVRSGIWTPHDHGTGRQFFCLLYHQIYS